MHEMGLAGGILEVVLDIAQDRPVKGVYLQVGTLHAVVPESLMFSFELAAQDTAAAHALLHISKVEAVFQCTQCNEITFLGAPPFNCGSCGSADLTISAGDELLVDAIELEDGTMIRKSIPADAELVDGHLKEHMAVDGRHGGPP
jgi:hydrogenase nickel incorporation protein HypA/HybF